MQVSWESFSRLPISIDGAGCSTASPYFMQIGITVRYIHTAIRMRIRGNILGVYVVTRSYKFHHTRENTALKKLNNLFLQLYSLLAKILQTRN